MKTVKTLLFVVALFIGINANAQLGINPLSFGIKGGVNMSNFSGDPEDTSAKAGWNAGITVDVSLPANFYIASGVELTTKGAKYKQSVVIGGDAISLVEAKANPMYIQVPVHLGYKIKAFPTTNIVFHGGPYWAYGISGKTKVEGQKYDFFGSDANEAKRNDFGLGFGAGVEFLGKITAGIGCDFGLLNISRVDNYTVRNQNAYFSVGYKF